MIKDNKAFCFGINYILFVFESFNSKKAAGNVLTYQSRPGWSNRSKFVKGYLYNAQVSIAIITAVITYKVSNIIN